MNLSIINEGLSPGSRILVAPLDWGLGHATRCIPLIREWGKSGHEVTLAAEGPIAFLLKQHFPSLEIIPLEGYHITYSKRWPIGVSILLQLPRFFHAIRKEHRWLIDLLKKRQFDLVISDNRYGLWNEQVPCVIITHQLFVRAPHWASFFNPFIRKRILKMIESFNQCWVPDVAGDDSLSGELSHAVEIPENVRYIGWLSRFDDSVIAETKYPVYDQLAILSGPEPQRSSLEKEMKTLAVVSRLRTLIVQGKPDCFFDETNEDLRIVNHLSDDQLKHALLYSKRIYCRSGYSTLMDLMQLKRTATLIPTPGQSEQEYLADRMKELYGWEILRRT